MSSFSPLVSRSSLQRKALLTSLRDVSPAVMQERMQAEARELCLQASVLLVAARLRFLLSPRTADLFIAASATLS